jgi:DNA-binding NtrC family response regulator
LVTAEQNASHFISFSDQGVNLSRELEQFENRLIVGALRQANGITSKAAQLLHVNRTTLVEKMKRKGFASKTQGCSAF